VPAFVFETKCILFCFGMGSSFVFLLECTSRVAECEPTDYSEWMRVYYFWRGGYQWSVVQL
jgi:hypothetical protein